MNRSQKRRLARKGITQTRAQQRAVAPPTAFRLKYDITVPGGHLRSDHDTRVAGTLDAASEADLLRGIIVKLLDTYGFTLHDRAVSGVLGDVLNPLPKRLRGLIAYAVIEGLGLSISLDDEDVCDDPKCGAVLERAVHPDPPDDTPEEDLPLMMDVTRHAPECHVNRESDPERPEQSNRPAAYKQEPVVSILNPRFYEPLNRGEQVPETGGEQMSTVDADMEEFVVTEVDDGEREAGGAAGDDGERGPASDDAVAGAPGADASEAIE